MTYKILKNCQSCFNVWSFHFLSNPKCIMLSSTAFNPINFGFSVDGPTTPKFDCFFSAKTRCPVAKPSTPPNFHIDIWGIPGDHPRDNFPAELQEK